MVTVDILREGGWVRVGAVGQPGLNVKSATRISSNVTDEVVHFSPGEPQGNFVALVGQEVTLAIEMSDAMIYMVGFHKL